MLASLTATAQTTYKNPIYDTDYADPSVQRAVDGTFYSYATGCVTLKSTDLVNWKYVSNVFDRPTWNDSTYVKNGKQTTDYYSLWAADVNYVDGKYIMYYASALWGNGSRTGIGVATGNTPYKFTDKGRMFRSTEIKVENSIDPCYIEEGDKKYLAWGSFNGIYITELSDDGLSVKDMKNVKKIAGTAFEGAMIHKHGNHYYLFASTGSCCEGLNSTYQTVVGRSTNLMGPYLSKSGGLMTNNANTVIIRKNKDWVGPGHNSEIITDDEGQDWILYHAYHGNDASKGRVLLMDRLLWDNMGWPYIEGGTPSSTEQPAPIFYKGNGAHVGYKLTNADFMYSNFKGWTTSNENTAEFASGQGTCFMPLMHVKGGKFSIEQSKSGLTDGIYELKLNNTLNKGKVTLKLGIVPTEVAITEDAASDATNVSNNFLKNQNQQSAYGMVVNGALKIRIDGELIDEDAEYWAGNIDIINRSEDANAMTTVKDWYVNHVNYVVNNTDIDDYYKGKLNGYLQTIEGASSNETIQKTLIEIHKLIDRLNVADSITDIESVSESRNSKTYDLLGRPVNETTRKTIVIKDNKKVIN